MLRLTRGAYHHVHMIRADVDCMQYIISKLTHFPDYKLDNIPLSTIKVDSIILQFVLLVSMQFPVVG